VKRLFRLAFFEKGSRSLFEAPPSLLPPFLAVQGPPVRPFGFSTPFSLFFFSRVKYFTLFSIDLDSFFLYCLFPPVARLVVRVFHCCGNPPSPSFQQPRFFFDVDGPQLLARHELRFSSFCFFSCPCGIFFPSFPPLFCCFLSESARGRRALPFAILLYFPSWQFPPKSASCDKGPFRIRTPHCFPRPSPPSTLLFPPPP